VNGRLFEGDMSFRKIVRELLTELGIAVHFLSAPGALAKVQVGKVQVELIHLAFDICLQVFTLKMPAFQSSQLIQVNFNRESPLLK
jgi:hypothetical protein